ncbi:aspartate/glutamate racemase family protein [Oceanimonas smirnovii]|uniref:Aspartate/glutamate racemase family protein n=1 Tax=Oceanimonas smirnovii TaxID=264574 RepID=A0ABW7P0B3_9GAMM
MPEVAKTLMLINPNSSESTTAAMVALAGQVAGGGVQVQGLTNTGVPALLTTPAEIRAATAGVLELGTAAAAKGSAALMIAAFSDPGLAELRQRVKVPVVGIAESAYLAAAREGRRFAIATITPDAELLAFFKHKAMTLGLEQQFCGTRVTTGDPTELVMSSDKLDHALSEAVCQAVVKDGADAVIIGGGPLTGSALRLQPHFDIPLVVPVLAATRAAVMAINKESF